MRYTRVEWEKGRGGRHVQVQGVWGGELGRAAGAVRVLVQ